MALPCPEKHFFVAVNYLLCLLQSFCPGRGPGQSLSLCREGTVDMDMTMSNTNCLRPMGPHKAFPIWLRLGMAKSSSGPSVNAGSVCKLTLTVSSSMMFTSWDCSPTDTAYQDQPAPPLCVKHNKLTKVLGNFIVDVSLSENALPTCILLQVSSFLDTSSQVKSITTYCKLL